jgi:hypothetical protein
VILAARWPLYADTDIASVLDELKDVPRVIVMGPLPELPALPTKCVAKRQIARCDASRAAFDSSVEPIRKALRKAVAHHPNAEFVDPTDYFCNATTCPLMRDGHVMFWDNNHITASAARAFYATKP